MNADAHGCPACPHPGIGPAIIGSPTVNINKRPALRVDDMGIHAACCGPNMWTAQMGSTSVFINKKAAHRMNDMTRHCGGVGKLIEGSADVIVGDSGGGGGGGGGGSAQGSATAGSTQTGTGKADQGTVAAKTGSGGTDAAAKGAAQGALSEMPQPAQATWKVQYDDGVSATKVKAAYAGPTGPKDIEGTSGSVPGLSTTDKFDLTLSGTEKVKAKLTDEEGKGVAEARLRIDRAFGSPIEVTTDASGAFEADGFLGEEFVDITLVALRITATGKVTDEAGKALAGAKLKIHREGGDTLDVVTDASGKYEVPGLLPGEALAGITVVALADKASGKIVDEQGNPVAGVKVRIYGDGGSVTLATTDATGKYEAEGLMPGEGYAIAVEPKK